MDPQLVDAVPDSADVIVRLVVAALLGGALGAEREFDGQDAGLRTHLLLCLGAALFGVTSVGAFADFAGDPNETNIRIDVTRIASYVAAGIGFIGGGTILKHRGTVTGNRSGPGRASRTQTGVESAEPWHDEAVLRWR